MATYKMVLFLAFVALSILVVHEVDAGRIRRATPQNWRDLETKCSCETHSGTKTIYMSDDSDWRRDAWDGE
jgi:hypothetical protein